MATLYLTNWHNYYNRIADIKPTIQDYIAATQYIEQNINFVIGDGVSTSAIINSEKQGNYVVITGDGDEIQSRWFVMEQTWVRKGQTKLTLRRDVIADNWDEIVNSTAYIEKGYVPATSPFIWNKESLSVNQIKTREILLKDPLNCAWIVGYISRNTNYEQITTPAAQVAADIDLGNGDINTYEFYNYTNLASPAQALYGGFIPHTYEVITKNGLVHYFSASDARYITAEMGYAADKSTINSVGSGLAANLKPVLGQLSSYGAIQLGAATQTQLNDFLSQKGKIIKCTHDGKTTYYKVRINQKDLTATNTLMTGALYNTMNNAATNYISGTPNQYSYAYSYQYTSYSIVLDDITESYGSYKFQLQDNRAHLLDAPYDMFAIPYGIDHNVCMMKGLDTESYGELPPESALNLAFSFANKYSDALYDLQLLPYCPISGLSGNSEEYMYLPTDMPQTNYFTITLGNKVAGYGFFGTTSKFSINVPVSSPVFRYASDPIEAKINNQCNMYRLCSPNGSNAFEFGVQTMGKSIDYFNVDCTYKPYTPYIKVNPPFGGLYGKDFDDTRGLVIQGDFSLPSTSNAFAQYELNNKNYSNIFAREVQYMEYQNEKQGIADVVNAIAGTVTGGATGAAGGSIMGGGLAGMGVGAALGGVASGAAGIADVILGKEMRTEALNYKKDLFNMSLQNIKARPDGLARSSAFTANNKIYPFVEYYTCTAEEKEAFENKLKYNGMTINVIGKPIDYMNNGMYFKCRLIRIPSIEDTHMVTEIADELNMGFYLEE